MLHDQQFQPHKQHELPGCHERSELTKVIVLDYPRDEESAMSVHGISFFERTVKDQKSNKCQLALRVGLFTVKLVDLK
jgi:hypothetical protein